MTALLQQEVRNRDNAPNALQENMSMVTLADLTAAAVSFRVEGDWAEVHSAGQLAAALAIDAAKILEVLLWQDDSAVDGMLMSGRGGPRRGSQTRLVGEVFTFQIGRVQ